MTPIARGPYGATPLDPDELEGLKFKHVTTRAELDQLEQANIQEGLVWLSKRRKQDVLSEDFVRVLHKRLFGEVWDWVGTFRLTEKNIGIDPVQIPVQLRMLLEDARFWAENNIYMPLEAGARFHHRLVQIHPFANGNGRHARIAADVYLSEHFDHKPIDWSGGQTLASDSPRRKDYIRALRAADGYDLSALLKFAGVEDN